MARRATSPGATRSSSNLEGSGPRDSPVDRLTKRGVKGGEGGRRQGGRRWSPTARCGDRPHHLALVFLWCPAALFLLFICYLFYGPRSIGRQGGRGQFVRNFGYQKLGPSFGHWHHPAAALFVIALAGLQTGVSWCLGVGVGAARGRSLQLAAVEGLLEG